MPYPFLRSHAVTSRLMSAASSMSSCWPIHIGNWASQPWPPVLRHSARRDVCTAVLIAMSHSCVDQSVASKMSSLSTPALSISLRSDSICEVRFAIFSLSSLPLSAVACAWSASI